MNCRTTFIFGLALLLYSCRHEPEKKLPIPTTTDTEAQIIQEAQPKVISDSTNHSLLKELNLSLEDPSINEYFKEVYRAKKIVKADDEIMLSITDSLFSKNPKHDFFYFLVFTKSMNGSDGFYSEALGLSALNFIKSNTEQFADYFNIGQHLNVNDMSNWADYVNGEIRISREDEELEALKELELELLENIKGNRKEYLVVIEQFLEKIKSTMPQHRISKHAP